jgi:hypothetical protein
MIFVRCQLQSSGACFESAVACRSRYFGPFPLLL